MLLNIPTSSHYWETLRFPPFGGPQVILVTDSSKLSFRGSLEWLVSAGMTEVTIPSPPTALYDERSGLRDHIGVLPYSLSIVRYPGILALPLVGIQGPWNGLGSISVQGTLCPTHYCA